MLAAYGVLGRRPSATGCVVATTRVENTMHLRTQTASASGCTRVTNVNARLARCCLRPATRVARLSLTFTTVRERATST